MSNMFNLSLYLVVPLLVATLVSAQAFYKEIVSPRISSVANLSGSMAIAPLNDQLISGKKDGRLLKGEVIRTDFVAKEDNLGLILAKFDNFHNISSDTIIFRLREKDTGTWVFQANYKVDQFQPNQYFPFGFPKISNSRGKSYTFEMESLAGTLDDSVGLSKSSRRIAVSYELSKQELFNDVFRLFRFGLIKSAYALGGLDWYKAISAYLFVLFILVFWREKNLVQSLSHAAKQVKRCSPLFIICVKYLWRCSLYLIYPVYTFLYYLLKSASFLHRKYFPFIHILIILLIALVVRVEYYWNPIYLDQSTFFTLGGGSDYHWVYYHTIQLLSFEDKGLIGQRYFKILLELDYLFNVRLAGVFIQIFGFIKGLHYFTYFIIFIGSLVAALPFTLLSIYYKRFSIGGFVASLMLAVNPLSIWLATGRHLDVLTALFLSLFLIFYVFALQKKSYKLSTILVFVGLLDITNRGLMVLNDLPALALFGIFYLLSQKNALIKRFPFIRIKKADLVYAFYPLILFLLLYMLIDFLIFTLTTDSYYMWYQKRKACVLSSCATLSPFELLGSWNPLRDPESVFGRSLTEKLFQYYLQINIAFIEFIKLIKLPIELVGVLMVILLSKLKYPLQRKEKVILLLPLINLAIFFAGQKLFDIFLKHDTTIENYIRLDNISLISLFVFTQFIAAQLLFIRKEFILFSLVTVTYIFVLGYSIFIHFSDRHFVQIILTFFVTLGLTIEKMLNGNLTLKRDRLLKYSVIVLIIFMSAMSVIEFTKSSSRLAQHINSSNVEVEFLEEVEKRIPKDAIILVGHNENENIVLIHEHVKRDVIFNLSLPDPVFIPYGSKVSVDNLPFGQSNKFSFKSITKDPSKFNSYMFYLLDYDANKLDKVIREKNEAYGVDKENVILLKTDVINGRGIYRLMLKED